MGQFCKCVLLDTGKSHSSVGHLILPLHHQSMAAIIAKSQNFLCATTHDTVWRLQTPSLIKGITPTWSIQWRGSTSFHRRGRANARVGTYSTYTATFLLQSRNYHVSEIFALNFFFMQFFAAVSCIAGNILPKSKFFLFIFKFNYSLIPFIPCAEVLKFLPLFLALFFLPLVSVQAIL